MVLFFSAAPFTSPISHTNSSHHPIPSIYHTKPSHHTIPTILQGDELDKGTFDERHHVFVRRVQQTTPRVYAYSRHCSAQLGWR